MKRMFLVSVIFLFFILAVSTVSAQRFGNPRPGLLLKGGHVIDPKNNINSVLDVLIKDGKIARVEKNIPETEAGKIVDVSGYCVSPGFVDIHTHLYYSDDTPSWRWVVPDSYGFPHGVTTLVDAGCAGAETFEDYKKRSIDRARVRVLVFLNISKKGMTKREYENDPYMFDHKLAAETAKKYPDIIVGFKCAHYDARNYDELRKPWTSLDSTIAAGNLANLPCMFDFHPAPPMKGYPERSFRDILLKKMRPGDIYTHVFYWGFPSINKDGKVNPDLFKAQERGGFFDVGHGFLPNSISTDVHGGSIVGAMANMNNVMSKFLAMGIPLEEVIRLSTINPATEIKRPDLGHMSVGAKAELAVFEVEKGEFGFTDIRGAKLIGDSNIKTFMTIFDGRIVFNPYGLGATLWDEIPKDDSYWVNPNKQQW